MGKDAAPGPGIYSATYSGVSLDVYLMMVLELWTAPGFSMAMIYRSALFLKFGIPFSWGWQLILSLDSRL